MGFAIVMFIVLGALVIGWLLALLFDKDKKRK